MKRASVRTHYIIMVLVLMIGIFRMFSNPHRLAYMFEKLVSQKEVDEQAGFWNGYPAGVEIWQYYLVAEKKGIV